MQDGINNPPQYFGITAEQLHEIKTKDCNAHFFRIYEFLSLDCDSSETQRIAKTLLIDAFNQYRRVLDRQRNLTKFNSSRPQTSDRAGAL
jgi:hypothetical protein